MSTSTAPSLPVKVPPASAVLPDKVSVWPFSASASNWLAKEKGAAIGQIGAERHPCAAIAHACVERLGPIRSRPGYAPMVRVREGQAENTSVPAPRAVPSVSGTAGVEDQGRTVGDPRRRAGDPGEGAATMALVPAALSVKVLLVGDRGDRWRRGC